MISVCAPRLAICARMAACAPCPMASMAITAATPMITPSMVKTERRVLRRKARWAMRMAMSTCVTVSSPLAPGALGRHRSRGGPSRRLLRPDALAGQQFPGAALLLPDLQDTELGAGGLAVGFAFGRPRMARDR